MKIFTGAKMDDFLKLPLTVVGMSDVEGADLG